MNIFEMFKLKSPIRVMDVGASAIAEVPIYKKILEMGLAHLYAFDGDKRQTDKIIETYGRERVDCFDIFLFDGTLQTVFLCVPESGMTSLFKPKKEALEYFNGFSKFGEVQSTEQIQTSRLDDVKKLKNVDFLKMDVQGAELGILKNGTKRLNNCLAVQLEVSYFCLYEKQPTFGEVDVYMRDMGYVPHRFLDVKKWSIAPTIFNGNFRIPGNQLLESDIIYIKDPLRLNEISNEELQKFATLAHYCFQSVDLCVFLLIEMERRGLIQSSGHQNYLKNIKDYT
jgi:FkbM family methyltransferase